jgi:hypothetical protein
MCEPIEEIHRTVEDFKLYAELDKENTMNMMGRGTYMCYCRSYGSYEDFLDTESLCYEYQRQSYKSITIFNIITASVVCFNLILRFLIIFLVSKIGIKS